MLQLSRGRLTIKIHMSAETFGRPLRLLITAVQASDIASASNLLDGPQAGAVPAAKVDEGNDLRDWIAGMNAAAVISSQRRRKLPSSIMSPSKSIATRSSDALAASSISDASPPATIAASSTAKAFPISPEP